MTAKCINHSTIMQERFPEVCSDVLPLLLPLLLPLHPPLLLVPAISRVLLPGLRQSPSSAGLSAQWHALNVPPSGTRKRLHIP